MHTYYPSKASQPGLRLATAGLPSTIEVDPCGDSSSAILVPLGGTDSDTSDIVSDEAFIRVSPPLV